MTHPIPTEDQESIAFAQMLRFKKYPFWHIVNEAKTSNIGALMKAKRMGWNPGLPDYLIIKGRELIFIELKRQKGSKVSSEQADTLYGLNRTKVVRAAVCQGAEEAIKFVEKKSTKLKQ